MDGRRRRWVLLAVVLLDVAGLVLATWWVVRRGSAAAAAAVTPGNATSLTALPTASGSTAFTVPQRAAGTAADRKVKGGPKYVTCATTDSQGTVWVGSQDQGVWSYANGQWTPYNATNGLADNDVSAVAADALGRIWVGHPDHGVSIYNGQEWRTYDRFDGPGSSRIFCIAVSPVNGDVWLGTDGGLARYAPMGDAWTTWDRSTGLPAADVTSLAVDSTGTVYAGLDSGGIGIATAADHYATWKTVSGPDDLPIVSSGPGLPSPLVNAILVTRPDDTVYVGTCHGLARSVDHGTTWTFVRGKNWPALAKGRYTGVPDGFKGTPPGTLADDWVSALAQDGAGVLWVGYREAGFEAFPNLAAKADHTGKGKVSAITPEPDGHCLVGTWGDNLTECGTSYAGPPLAARPVAPTEAFPTPAKPTTVAELDALRRRVEALPPGRDGVDFLGDDWSTRGDWCGRYGARAAVLLGYHDFKDSPGYGIATGAGPWRQAVPRYYWEHGDKRPSAQVDPRNGTRALCEFNDESYDTNAHPRNIQGPDIYIGVTVPAGVHRVSLYWSGGPDNYFREYPLDVRSPAGPTPTADLDDADVGGGREPYGNTTRLDRARTVAAELSPPSARTRVPALWRPVHKQYLIRGAGTWYFRVDRNASVATKVAGAFIDPLDHPGDHDAAYPHPPAPSKTDYTTDPGPAGAAARLWAALDGAVGRQGYADLARRARNLAYGAGAAAGVDPDTLARWRYQMPLWLADDHPQFDQFVKTRQANKTDDNP
jgi:hypothetical protein